MVPPCDASRPIRSFACWLTVIRSPLQEPVLPGQVEELSSHVLPQASFWLVCGSTVLELRLLGRSLVHRGKMSWWASATGQALPADHFPAWTIGSIRDLDTFAVSFPSVDSRHPSPLLVLAPSRFVWEAELPRTFVPFIRPASRGPAARLRALLGLCGVPWALFLRRVWRAFALCDAFWCARCAAVRSLLGSPCQLR